MKAILLSLVLIPTLCFSQQKKDSKIIVTASDSVNLVNRLSLALYEKGYSLEQKDEGLGFISTSEKQMEKFALKMKLKVLIKGSVITITGEAGTVMDGIPISTAITFNGSKRSPMMDGWKEMESIAKQFGNNVSYSK
jgi:hypothetical protein